MAGSVNKVIIVGRLGVDPELTYTSSGMAMARLRVATSEVWIDKNTGQRQERTEWHRVVAWGKLAAQAKEYLSKGRLIYVEGRLQTRTYTKDGENRYITEVIANTIKFLDSAKDAAVAANNAPEPPEPEPQGVDIEPQDDFSDTDIPF